jgi:Ni/Co efflux regulator RcnB
MRTALLIALAAATALSSPAEARDHDRHHRGDRHHERHDRHRYDRHRYDRHDYDRHRHHNRHRVYVGYRLPSLYYGPQYYVTDYRHYGLRAPGRHLRWIRYGYDLLLVDVRRGVVLRVIPGGYY